MQVSQNVVRKLHSDPTFKPDKDSVVVQLMGQIRNTEDTISSVLVALEYGPDMATIYRLNQIKGTYETTVKPLANLEGEDDPEESQATLEGIDDPVESLANLEGENSAQKSEIIAIKKKFAEMETDMKSKIQHIQKKFAEKETDMKSKIQHIEKANEYMIKEVGLLEGRLSLAEKFAEMEEKAKKYMIKEVGLLEGRLSLAEKRTAVCGIKGEFEFSSDTVLTFDRVYDEVNSGGVLEESGYFTAQITGVYFITLKTTVGLEYNAYLYGYLKLSSGQYDSNGEDWFIYSRNDAGPYIRDQASASRYVKMAAGETLHIDLSPHNGEVGVYQSMLCVSLYSASG